MIKCWGKIQAEFYSLIHFSPIKDIARIIVTAK